MLGNADKEDAIGRICSMCWLCEIRTISDGKPEDDDYFQDTNVSDSLEMKT
jgi:hypothetical protein